MDLTLAQHRPSCTVSRTDVCSGIFIHKISDSSNLVEFCVIEQPYRTAPLTLPSAKSHIVAKLSDKVIVASKGVPGLRPLPKTSFKNPTLNTNQKGKDLLPLGQAAKTVVDAINRQVI